MVENDSSKSVYDIAVEIAKEIGDTSLVEGVRFLRDEKLIQVARANTVFLEITSGLPECPIEELRNRIDTTIHENLDSQSIWEFLLLCSNRWESIKAISIEQIARNNMAKKGAAARHAEHHSMKAEVFQWLDVQSKFKSNEAAATAITKQQPIAHVTARDWYKEWKKLRSAGTP